MFPPIVFAFAFVVPGGVEAYTMSLSPKTSTYSNTCTLTIDQDTEYDRPTNNAEKVIMKGLTDPRLMELIEKNIEEHREIWIALATS